MRMVPLVGDDAKRILDDQSVWKSAGTTEPVKGITPELEARAEIEPTYKDTSEYGPRIL
jgi:hypothetical protein